MIIALCRVNRVQRRVASALVPTLREAAVLGSCSSFCPWTCIRRSHTQHSSHLRLSLARRDWGWTRL